MGHISFLTGYSVRDKILPIFITVNSLSWYFPLHMFLLETSTRLEVSYLTLLMFFGIYYCAILISTIAGMLLRRFISRNYLLLIWIFLGIFASFFMLWLYRVNTLGVYAIFALIGIALGLGFPHCLAYLGGSINIECRGGIGGITLFFAHLGMLLIGFLTMTIGFIQSVILFTLWRTLCLIFLLIKRGKEEYQKEIIDVKYRTIVSERSFILYLVPWITFCLVNFFEGPLQQHYWGVEISAIVSTVEFGVAGIAALIGGFLADMTGRKRIIILGYVLLGLGYALLSILPENPISIGIYALFDGVAWGLFALMFFVVIWGDLADNKVKEKYYVLGVLPFIILSYIWIIVIPFIKIISISMSFSLASFFLFLAVIPLMYAPETLPEKLIRQRELREYVEKAKRIREKYEKGKD